jgi:hypothetical protein
MLFEGTMYSPECFVTIMPSWYVYVLLSWLGMCSEFFFNGMLSGAGDPFAAQLDTFVFQADILHHIPGTPDSCARGCSCTQNKPASWQPADPFETLAKFKPHSTLILIEWAHQSRNSADYTRHMQRNQYQHSVVGMFNWPTAPRSIYLYTLRIKLCKFRLTNHRSTSA